MKKYFRENCPQRKKVLERKKRFKLIVKKQRKSCQTTPTKKNKRETLRYAFLLTTYVVFAEKYFFMVGVRSVMNAFLCQEMIII